MAHPKSWDATLASLESKVFTHSAHYYQVLFPKRCEQSSLGHNAHSGLSIILGFAAGTTGQDSTLATLKELQRSRAPLVRHNV